NQGLVALAFSGVEANLVLFSKLVLKKTNVEAANTFSIWMGTTYFFSLIGAFISDSYLGRYLTCIIFQFVFIIGFMGLSLSTRDCEQKGGLSESNTQNHFPVFYISLYLIALGSGGFDPALPTLAADQFDENEPNEQRSKTLIYGYFYAASNLGSLIAETVLAYIATTGHWVMGFWICTCCACVSFVVLLSGTLRYRHHKSIGNPISKLTQVIVAFFSTFIQMRSLFVEQGSTMDRSFYKFQIPPASMSIFDTINTSTFIIIFDVLMIPLYKKLMKKSPKLPSELQNIGIGFAMTTITLIVAGFVEKKRLNYGCENGEEKSSLTIFWLIPQYMFLGIAEAFVSVAQMNFFTSQTPDGLESLGMGLHMFSSALGCYVGNIILTAVNKITSSGQGKHGWVSPNLNDGHLDMYFFLSSFIIFVDLLLYIICAKRYKEMYMEKREEVNWEEESIV
ncbi:hypothetical protein RYX36_012162, partial [Vicia faba]